MMLPAREQATKPQAIPQQYKADLTDFHKL
jgi:hypothetical protein